MFIQALLFKAKPKIQRITFSGENVEFQFYFQSEPTGMLTQANSSMEIERELNALSSVQKIGSVSVFIDKSSGTNFIINIVFVSSDPMLPDVEADSIHQSLVTQEFSQEVEEFTLEFGSRSTKTLTPTTSNQDLEQSITELFSTKCSHSEVGETYFVDSFEVGTRRALPAGTRDASVPAFCGRYSTRNPSVLFRSGQSIQEGTKNVLREFNVTSTPSRNEYKYVSLAN